MNTRDVFVSHPPLDAHYNYVMLISLSFLNELNIFEFFLGRQNSMNNITIMLRQLNVR
jgi:hypothetical protein